MKCCSELSDVCVEAIGVFACVLGASSRTKFFSHLQSFSRCSLVHLVVSCIIAASFRMTHSCLTNGILRILKLLGDSLIAVNLLIDCSYPIFCFVWSRARSVGRSVVPVDDFFAVNAIGSFFFLSDLRLFFFLCVILDNLPLNFHTIDNLESITLGETLLGWLLLSMTTGCSSWTTRRWHQVKRIIIVIILRCCCLLLDVHCVSMVCITRRWSFSIAWAPGTLPFCQNFSVWIERKIFDRFRHLFKLI